MTTNDTAPVLRLTLLMVLAVGLLVVLLSRLWFLQVLAGERYTRLAEANEQRRVSLEAPRGRILAEDGRELVKNRPAPTVSADPRALLNGLGEPVDEQAEQVLENLSVLLGMSQEDILAKLTSRKYSPFRPVPVKEDVPPEVVFFVQENAEHFTGVVAENLPVRTYPLGTGASHLLGYVSEISEQQLATEEFADYRAGELIGAAGLEKTYEHDLQGREGYRNLQVNARGTVLDVLDQKDPVRGNDLVTSIDLDLQLATERILEDGILASRHIRRTDGRLLPSVAGSAVVLDPRDGSIKAMASWPSYDPAEFVGGVGHAYWSFLQDPENHYPLINRAIQGTYPPGSVFKPVSGAAAIDAGLVGPNTPVSCPPAWQLGGITFRNWNTRHEGALDLSGALMRSCDTYFYELAWQMYQREERQLDETGAVDEVLPRIAEGFGLGDALGIDLPAERAGNIPSRAWKQEYWERNREMNCDLAQDATPGTYAHKLYTELCEEGYRWRGGDAVNSSIGQGDVLTTPLQIASAYGAIANGGTLWWPHVGQEILAPEGERQRQIEPRALGELPVDEATLAAIQQGLEDVVMAARGTAHLAFSGFPLDQIPVAGKTGTAEMKPKVPYAWFASYAPVDDPRYVVVVSVEEGGGGSQTAAPIARRILEAAFGLEVSPFEAGPANVD